MRDADLDPGSRNAVVALKPATRTTKPPAATGSRNAVVALKLTPQRPAEPMPWEKQERRGGIETRGGDVKVGSRFHEAGTPWWH